MKKPGLIQETMSTRKPRQKKLGLEGEKRGRDMIGQQFLLKKLSIENVVSMSSVYMTWQVQKPLVVFWVGIALSKRA